MVVECATSSLPYTLQCGEYALSLITAKDRFCNLTRNLEEILCHCLIAPVARLSASVISSEIMLLMSPLTAKSRKSVS